MGFNLFQNSTKSVPKQDSQIIRVPMTELEIGGRKSNLPSNAPESGMSVRHVSTGGK